METFTSNMLAILEKLDLEHSCHTDNTKQFLVLMLLKLFLDGGAMYLCCLKPLLSFLNMCSVSIVLVDLLLAISMISTLCLDVEASHRAFCYIMAIFSAAYSVLPLPMFCLGILDYYLEDVYAGKKSMKPVRNYILIVFMWTIAGIYAHATVQGMLLEQMRNVNAYIVCEIRESKAVTVFIMTLTTIMFLTLLPYFPLIPQWVIEADRISATREEIAYTRTSDLNIDLTTDEETKRTEEEIAMTRPSMHISLLLCFGMFWIPYLAVTTICATFEFGIPAYISVNLLWVQCVNSLMAGSVFWLRSDKVGPYTSLPENVCFWQAYWHLSKGTEAQDMSVVIFNPSKRNNSTPFYI